MHYLKIIQQEGEMIPPLGIIQDLEYYAFVYLGGLRNLQVHIKTN